MQTYSSRAPIDILYSDTYTIAIPNQSITHHTSPVSPPLCPTVPPSPSAGHHTHAKRLASHAQPIVSSRCSTLARCTTLVQTSRPFVCAVLARHRYRITANPVSNQHFQQMRPSLHFRYPVFPRPAKIHTLRLNASVRERMRNVAASFAVYHEPYLVVTNSRARPIRPKPTSLNTHGAHPPCRRSTWAATAAEAPRRSVLRNDMCALGGLTI